MTGDRFSGFFGSPSHALRLAQNEKALRFSVPQRLKVTRAVAEPPLPGISWPVQRNNMLRLYG